MSKKLVLFMWLGATIGNVSKCTAETVFRDTFNDRNASDGMPVTWVPVPGFPGTFDASSGDYFLAPSDEAIVATVPEYDLHDVSIRSQFRILHPSPPGGGVELLARADRVAVDAYLAGLNESGRVYIRRANAPGSFVFLDTDLRPLEEDVVMQFDVFGETLSLWAWPASESLPSAPLVTTTDSSLTQGEVGIDYFSSAADPMLGNAIFRYVHVANTHIPEPTTIILASILATLAGLRFWRRTDETICA
jgi:hypothetical protein